MTSKPKSKTKRKTPPRDVVSAGPAKGTRPPFPNGHALGLHHGARAPRVYEPIAADLAEGLLADRPDLAAYPEEVAAWARAEARARLLDKYAAEHGLLDENGEPRNYASRLMLPIEREAARGRAALGLTPGTEAALARERAETAHLAVDIEAIIARGREVNARRLDVASELDPVAAALADARQAGEAVYQHALQTWPGAVARSEDAASESQVANDGEDEH